MEHLLEVKHLSVSIDSPAGEVQAVRDVSFALKKGEVLAIVGESGCGKSVLCKSIMKLMPKSARIKSGSISINGQDITGYREKDMQKLRGKVFSMIFQDPMTSLNPTIKIGKQIALFVGKIHAGGEDLIFPHHENEIAQSECCNGKLFARYWMHNAFLNIDNRKMSKSLGNFRTVREIGQQYDLQVLRFFMLNAHYRSPLNFSADLMESSKNALERIIEAASRLNDRKENAAVQTMSEEEKALVTESENYVKKFEEAMEDDFNTADALAAVFELVKFANTNVTEESSGEFAKSLLTVLVRLSDVLGLNVVKKEEILDKEIEDLIAARQEARKAKDFKRADEIRDELLEKGIILKDTREGVKWKRA